MDYDLIVVGAGWAGFNAARRAKELGLEVALIDKEKIGGTCLNHGCIPTKALIQSAKIYSLAKKAKAFGIELAPPQINFNNIQARKNRIIQQLSQGMHSLLKGVDFLNSPAQIVSPNIVETSEKKLTTKFILIATGSKPMELKNFKFDGKKVISSDELLELKEIPKSLLIIGGGVIGCEFASLFNNLDSQVTVAEKMAQLLPGIDKETAKKLETLFKKKGIKVFTAIDATTLNFDDYDLVLLCIGRTPNTENLFSNGLNIESDRGKIIVDDYLKTSVPNIYAAGDCTAKVMLAHFAAYQGRLAVDNMADPENARKYTTRNIPSCIFTEPEIANIGLSQEEAENQGIETKINKFDFLGSGMAKILEETDGFIKLVSDKKTGQIIGGSIIGPRATELISILSVAIQSGFKLSQLQNIMLPHPTLSETITDTANSDYGF